MSGFLKLINGLPVMVAPYDESIYYSGGLAALTAITLPNSGSFTNASAKDIIVIVNDTIAEVSRDFDVLGTSPYVQIRFTSALPNDTVVRFRKNI